MNVTTVPPPAPVTVIVPTVPGREHLLARALMSVRGQTVPPVAVLVRWQAPPGGLLGPVHIAEQRNALLAAVTTPWVATLDDDDEWLPGHLETCARFFDHDVVYSWPDQPDAIARVDATGWPAWQVEARLRVANFVSSSACVRTDWLAKVGGWPADGTPEREPDGKSNVRFPEGAWWEDHALYIRLAAAGARFACTRAETWRYDLAGTHEHAQVTPKR